MSEILIPIDAGAPQVAGEQLGRHIERLSIARKRIINVQYPPRYADRLGIADMKGSGALAGMRLFHALIFRTKSSSNTARLRDIA